MMACSSQKGPSLVEPDDLTVLAEPTPSAEDLITGKWVSIISETQSRQAGNLNIDIKQLRFSTPERLLPDLTVAQKTDFGIADVPSLIAVRINVENLGSDTAEFNPSGFGNVLTVNGVETQPIFALTGEAISLIAGEKEGFMIFFPVTSNLNDVRELTFTIREQSVTYTDLNIKDPF
jgi:hypothetical protein